MILSFLSPSSVKTRLFSLIVSICLILGSPVDWNKGQETVAPYLLLAQLSHWHEPLTWDNYGRIFGWDPWEGDRLQLLEGTPHVAQLLWLNQSTIRFSVTWPNLWLWPLTTEHVDHQNAVREFTNACVVFGVSYHHLRWHVGRSARSLCHATDLWSWPRSSQNFGCHIGSEEDIVGREISVKWWEEFGCGGSTSPEPHQEG